MSRKNNRPAPVAPIVGRRLARLILAACLVLAVAAGQVVGAKLGAEAVDNSIGLAILTALHPTDDPGSPPREDTIPAASVLRARDGKMAVATDTNYLTVTLAPGDAIQLRDWLRAGVEQWKDDYPLPEPVGRLDQPLGQPYELRITGAKPRTIRIDNPFANAALPDSLYRLIIFMSHPTGFDRSATTPFTPSALIVRSAPAGPIPLGDPTIYELPAGIDLTQASTAAGQRLDGSALAGFLAAWPVSDALTYAAGNYRLSSDQERHIVLIAWTVVWDDWTR